MVKARLIGFSPIPYAVKKELAVELYGIQKWQFLLVEKMSRDQEWMWK
jgi:hypothetical protein